MNKVVIFSLGDETGGPFALYQLAEAIESFGVPVEMAFFNSGNLQGNEHFCSIDYKPDFNMPSLLGKQFTLCQRFTKGDLLIFPEIYIDLIKHLHSYGYTNTVFWWLSWLKFPIQAIQQLDIAKALHKTQHIFQSEYARANAHDYGYDGLLVSDYTEIEHTQTIAWEDRKYDICYLPRKATGAEALTSAMAEDYRICKLDNMSHAETLAAVANSKVFVDFGTHPGKDRIAREAAILNCIPVVHYAGAATLKEDVPLPDYLKPKTELFLTDGHIKNLIHILLDNHQSVLDELSTYREQIQDEKAVFYRQTKDFLTQSAFI